MDIAQATQPSDAPVTAERLDDVERSGRSLTAARVGDWPIHLFRLADLDVDREAFLRELRPSFDRTVWDLYDVLNAQLGYLRQLPSPSLGAEVERLERVPSPPERLAGVRALIDTLADEERRGAEAFLPHRRRAMRKYALTHLHGERWHIQPLADRTFSQAVADYRARAREFALLEPEVTYHEGILSLIASVAETVRGYRPEAHRLQAVVHQMTVIARRDRAASPAPEGVHQDGADFVVSALVVERREVRGGVSRVREGAQGAPVLEVELAPGEGILQADAGSPLWHEVSPIELAEESDSGHRMTFGVDVHVGPA